MEPAATLAARLLPSGAPSWVEGKTMPMLDRRYSPLRGRRLSVREAMMERIATGPVGFRYLLHVAPRIDRFLIPRSKGRWSSAGRDVVGLLTTTGAKSGKPRTQPITVIEHDGSLILTGSNYGRASHPSWSTNLRAHPECILEFRGPPRRYRAVELAGEERDAAWATVTDFYRGYAIYEQTAGPRRIRLFRLDPLD
jgi:deazaflavin-dependent oxidoreductase (nitroreductase family)